jgi:hypothetical protein
MYVLLCASLFLSKVAPSRSEPGVGTCNLHVYCLGRHLSLCCTVYHNSFSAVTLCNRLRRPRVRLVWAPATCTAKRLRHQQLCAPKLIGVLPYKPTTLLLLGLSCTGGAFHEQAQCEHLQPVLYPVEDFVNTMPAATTLCATQVAPSKSEPGVGTCNLYSLI